MRYETTLVEQVKGQMASAMPTRFVSVPDDGSKPQPVKFDIETYSGKEGDNLILQIREVEIALSRA